MREPETHVRPAPHQPMRREWATYGQRLRWLLKQDQRLGWLELAKRAKRAGFYAPSYSTRLTGEALRRIAERDHAQ